MNIAFVPVSDANRDDILSLSVNESQQGFIETTAQCLKEALQLYWWCPVGIYDDTLIGFAMYGFFPNEGDSGRVWLDRFLIDKSQQGKGYATPVLTALITHIVTQYHCNELYLSIYEDNIVATAIYQKLGFIFNGELDENGEKIMILHI